MRAVGLLLLVAAGGGIGFLRAAALRRRAVALEAARRMVLWMTARLRYTAAPVGELVQQAATREEFRSLTLLMLAARGLQTAPFPLAWRQAVAESVKESGFTPEDADLLRQFGDGLGKTDLSGQQTHGELYAELFKEQQRQAARCARERGRAEWALWTAGAAMLALLLA